MIYFISKNCTFQFLTFVHFYNSLWELLNAEHSHIAQVTVPLLLHCVTLPCGTDTFWRLVQEEFHNSDWRVRFVAGNRIYNLEWIGLCHLFIKIERLNIENIYIFFCFSRACYINCKIHGLDAIAKHIESSSCISKCVLLLDYKHGRQ